MSDLFLGCGLLYVVVFLALGALGVDVTQTVTLGALPVLAILAGAPHYGATLLRVYEHRENRRKYAVFAVWITLALGALFAASLFEYSVGVLLVSLYFNWNPWHYSGQNYGLAVMFLRRRGVEVPTLAKRLLYASFTLSAFLAIVAMNAGRPMSSYGQGGESASAKIIEPFYRFEPIGLPDFVVTVLLTAGLVAYTACLVIAVAMLLRKSTLADIGPSLLLVATQSLWFVIPIMTAEWGVLQGFLPFDEAHGEYTFLFIAVGHAVQYLWVTSYFAKKTESYPGNTRYWLRCLFAGSALWNLPPLLLATMAFGTVAFTEGLGMLVAAIVNLHHFVLDGAIWKLRDDGIGRVLLRAPAISRGLPASAPRAEGGRSWGHSVVAVLGALGVALALTAWWENEFGFVRSSQRGDEVRMQLATERLELIGRPRAEYHRHLAAFARRKGDDDKALVELDKSLTVRDHPKSHFAKGHIYADRGEWDASADAYERAYAIDSKPVKLIYRLSHALLEAGRLQRAREVLRAGLTLHPHQDLLTRQLRAVNRAIAESA